MSSTILTSEDRLYLDWFRGLFPGEPRRIREEAGHVAALRARRDGSVFGFDYHYVDDNGTPSTVTVTPVGVCAKCGTHSRINDTAYWIDGERTWLVCSGFRCQNCNYQWTDWGSYPESHWRDRGWTGKVPTP